MENTRLARRMTLAAALVWGLAACGDDAAFPNLDGDGDIASPSAWGRPVPSASRLSLAAGTYTASSDVSFAGVTQTGTPVVITNLPPRTVTFTAAALIPGNSEMEMRGGTYDFDGKSFSANSPWGKKNASLVVSGGAVVTNVGSYRFTDCGSGCKLTVKDGATLHLKADLRGTYYGNGTKSVLNVLSGGHLVVNSGSQDGPVFSTDHQYTTSNGGRSLTVFTIAGEGSSLDVTATKHSSAVGYGQSCASLFVTNLAQAAFNHTYLYVGYGANSSNCLMRVADRAAVTAQTIALGASGSHDNVLEILDGAHVKCQSVLFGRETAAAHDNLVLVSNAVLEAGYVASSSSAAYGNRLEIVGSLASVTNDAIAHEGFSQAFGNDTMNASIIVRDGAALVYPNNVCMGVYAAPATNEIVLLNGGRLLAANAFYLGSSAKSNVRHSTVTVGSGSILRTGAQLYSNGEDNRLVVSNGTVFCPALKIGYTDQWTAASSGAELVLQGDNPRICATNTSSSSVSICTGAKLAFDVPPDGYAAKALPIWATSSISFQANSVIDIRGLGEYVERHPTRSRINLIKTYRLSVPADVLAAANAALPKGCSLDVYNDGKGSDYLRLTAKKLKGFVLVVR